MYRVIFELENCMAELLINEYYFVLYKNISFEVVTIINDKLNIYIFGIKKMKI